MAEHSFGLERRYTRRLFLRRPEETDLDFVVSLFALPELVSHRPDPKPDTCEQSATRLMRDIAHWDAHGFGRWAVEVEGIPIGFGGLTVSSEFVGLNLSYHFHPSRWGGGYASELAMESLHVAATILHADKVIGLARPANPASRRVLEKCGFTLEKEVELHGAPTMLFAIRLT